MRYLVFGGETCYASGGAYDYIDGFRGLESAIKCANESIEKYQVLRHENGEEYTSAKIDWTHVFDTESKQVVHEPSGSAHNGGDMIVRLHNSRDLDT